MGRWLRGRASRAQARRGYTSQHGSTGPRAHGPTAPNKPYIIELGIFTVVGQPEQRIFTMVARP